MKDLKFEQKRSLSRREAADQLAAIAAALREGGDAELEFGSGTLSLRVPDDLRGEIEVEIGDGEIELEIELKWPTVTPRTKPSKTAPDTDEATARKSVPAEPGQSGTGSEGRRSGKRPATKTS
ncbi:amphi-Trp domain-containing protein [Streptomyces sp. NPDC017202]|uniref:amphi-Trp domain-containing protein n=1 Tax=Streptomyces sp. NPDC017202 TaxID=3364981 RepID=UPI003787E785